MSPKESSTSTLQLEHLQTLLDAMVGAEGIRSDTLYTKEQFLRRVSMSERTFLRALAENPRFRAIVRYRNRKDAYVFGGDWIKFICSGDEIHEED